MSNSEPTPEQKKQNEPDEQQQKRAEDEEACGKLMEVYVQEAKQYDEGLVKSWKDDMENTLVFSGLYSAILTAFAIESYRKLQEDPADASVALLHRISDQLVSLSNGGNTVIEAPQDQFTPTPAAVACNTLWFSSLILALCCAFLATLVQQWSRQFIHKSGLRRSSVDHARLYSFLYFGLKDFKMHAAVNLIPSMLHLSLFLFLGGLIAFLWDVDLVLAWIVGVALVVVLAVYIGFTIWPLKALNSPYQTPLSPMAWKLWQLYTHRTSPPAKSTFKKSKGPAASRGSKTSLATAPAGVSDLPLYHVPPTQSSREDAEPNAGHVAPPTLQAPDPHSQPGNNAGDVAPPTLQAPGPHPQPENKAPDTELSPARTKVPDLLGAVLAASKEPNQGREIECIKWTLSSLRNDEELLPLIEALPHAIYGSNGIHDNNLHLIRPLVEAAVPEADIIRRITSLMANASNSWFDKKHRARCPIAGPKALWALAFMFAERRNQFNSVVTSRESWFPEHLLDALDEASQSSTGDSTSNKPGCRYAISAMVLCAFDSQSTSQYAGRALRQFLQASRELEPFELKWTGSVLSEYLSKEMAKGFSFKYGLLDSYSSPGDRSIVPKINKERPEQIARLDVLAGICLQIPQLPEGDVELLLGFICERTEIDGWGSTHIIWDNCKSLRGLDRCKISRHFCNAKREYLYTLFNDTTYVRNNGDLLHTCVGRPHDRSNSDDDKNIVTAQIALATMVELKDILVGGPEEEEGEVFDVKAGRVVTLTTRLLEHCLPLADNAIATNDIVDAMEFILYAGYRIGSFKRPLFGEPVMKAVGEDLLVNFSEATLGACRWWAGTLSNTLSRNRLDIVAWIWQVWRYLKLPQSGKATQNLAEASELMLSPESLAKVEECKSEETSRVPAPPEQITQCLDAIFDQRFNFEDVLDRYKPLPSDDSMHSQGSTTPSDISNHPEESAIVEEGPDINHDGEGDGNLSS